MKLHYFAISLVLLVSACKIEVESNNADTQTSADTKASEGSIFPSKQVNAEPPYIVKEGCKFYLVTPSGTISTTSEHGSGLSGNATLNWDRYQMGLSECEVVNNPQNLTIY